MWPFRQENSDSTHKAVKIEEVCVITSTIITSHNDGTGCGPRCVTWYFLAKVENGECHELFSGKKLEKEEDTQSKRMNIAKFDTPYIRKVEPVKEYLCNKGMKKMDIQTLFDFITNMNVLGAIGALGILKTKNKVLKKDTDIEKSNLYLCLLAIQF